MLSSQLKQHKEAYLLELCLYAAGSAKFSCEVFVPDDTSGKRLIGNKHIQMRPTSLSVTSASQNIKVQTVRSVVMASTTQTASAFPVTAVGTKTHASPLKSATRIEASA